MTLIKQDVPGIVGLHWVFAGMIDAITLSYAPQHPHNRKLPGIQKVLREINRRLAPACIFHACLHLCAKRHSFFESMGVIPGR